MLKIENLKKNFGGIQAVKNVSFYAKKGEITAIIGPNGAGKTTIFNLLTGIYKCDEGNIYFNNLNITNKKPYQIAKLGITRTFQNLQIFSNMSVIENIMTGMHLKCKSGFFKCISGLNFKEEIDIKKRAFDFLKLLNLTNYANSQVSSLPIGILREVEIIRALASSPELLLLDEPAAGLNPAETEELGDNIKKLLSSGLTILLIEHDMNLVMKISNHIIVLNFGEKIAEGPPEQIQKNPEVIKAYLGE